MIIHTSKPVSSRQKPAALLAEQIFLKRVLGVTKTQISTLVRQPLTQENVRQTADLIGKADRVRERLKEIQTRLETAEPQMRTYSG